MADNELQKVEQETQAEVKDWAETPKAEIEEMQKRITELKANGATDADLVQFLVYEFGYREDIAQAEVSQGFPIFEQLKMSNEFDAKGNYA